MTKRIITTARILPDGQPFKLVGRFGWALKNLVTAGKRGCTPIDHPGPRWSAYVHKLRKEYGLVIETLNENHDGPFPGSHARYVLHTEVEILPVEDAADRRPTTWNELAATYKSISEVKPSFNDFGRSA